MGYKDDLKQITAFWKHPDHPERRRMSASTESTTASRKAANRKAANEKKRKRQRQVSDAVKRWRQKHRAEYNAYMKAYQATRRALVTQTA